MSLSPEVFSRARSSSTVGNITTARSRAISSTNPADFELTQPTTPLKQDAFTISTSPPSTSPQSQKMLNVLYTVASRIVPLHDALTSLPSNTSPKGKEKSDLDLNVALGAMGKQTAAWESEKAGATLVVISNQPNLPVADDVRPSSPSTARALAEPGQKRTRQHPRKTHRRQPSPFSSLFISPPTSELPEPATWSPRSSVHFPKFSPRTLSLHIPVPNHPPPTKVFLPLVFVCSLFFITLLPVVYSVWTLPIHSLHGIPKTINDIKAVAKELQMYASSGVTGMTHIIAVLALASVWKNAWSVPGSAVLNVLAGALMNPVLATLLQTVLTTLGSICSSLLSKPLAPLISALFPKALALTRSAFEGTPFSSPEATPVEQEETEKLLSSERADSAASKKTPIWVRLTILRLVGVVPWSALNLACGICDVPLWDCAVGGFIGMLPWTAVTCQIGDILQTVASTSSASADAPGETLSSLLASPSIIGKLVFLSVLSLAPVLMRDKLSDLVARRSGMGSGQQLSEKDSS